MYILGVANAAATVTMNSSATYRKGEYYQKAVSIGNSSAPQYTAVTASAVNGGSTSNLTGNVFLPQNQEHFIHDLDGNLTSDGRWTNMVWNAENRLVSMEGYSAVPTAAKRKLEFEYDYQGRRIRKKVSSWNGSAWVLATDAKFLYDGWNLISELNGSGSLTRSFTWGLDLSGSEQGAGGVGGLLRIAFGTTNSFPSFDGNGNVSALVNGTDGTAVGAYEYGPFGEVIRMTGLASLSNPFRFSTKFSDDESEQLYYGYRYYIPSTGKWPNRDPIHEADGPGIYLFVANSPGGSVDSLGLRKKIRRLHLFIYVRPGSTLISTEAQKNFRSLVDESFGNQVRILFQPRAAQPDELGYHAYFKYDDEWFWWRDHLKACDVASYGVQLQQSYGNGLSPIGASDISGNIATFYEYTFAIWIRDHRSVDPSRMAANAMAHEILRHLLTEEAHDAAEWLGGYRGAVDEIDGPMNEYLDKQLGHPTQRTVTKIKRKLNIVPMTGK